MGCTAASGPGRGKISGSTAASCRASRRAASTGGAPPATNISTCASGNGRPRIRCGCGPTARRPWLFRSQLAQESKLDRCLVVAFALAEILVQAGERVGMPGLMRPTGSRNVLDKMANAIVHDVAERPSLPPLFAPSSLAEIVVVSDFWSPMAQVRATLAQLSATGAHGHTVQIVDPAEETFPYSGRVEFIEPEGAGSITAGRAEAWKREYETPRRASPRGNPGRDRQARLELHHPSHRPAGDRTPARAACAPGRAAAGRDGQRASERRGATGEARMIPRPPARLRPAAGAARAVESAGAVVAAAAHSAAAAPHRLPADAAAVRHRAQGGDAAAHAVVAHAAAFDARRARDHRRRRPAVESAGCDLEPPRRRSRS